MNKQETTSPIQRVIAQHRSGSATGLYSVCCSHPIVLRAAMRVASDYGTLLLVESTSNQVDQFGGYTGMTPSRFHHYVQELARQCDFPLERLVLGGDHLGPNAWQKLHVTSAMADAEDLIAAYVSAGFHKIHLDCSMRCADDPEHLDDATIAARSARLAQVAEDAAAEAGLPPPVYVIGTEVPVPGGEAVLAQAGAVTSAQAAARTLEVHRLAFASHGLHEAWKRVVAMVVQPGVDFDHSHIQHYDADQARALSDFVVDQTSLVFEAHSTDYQRESALHEMVRDHFAILKVGPAATFALREGLLALCQIEDQLVAPGKTSRLMQVLDEAMLANPAYWRGHYSGSTQEQRVKRRYGLSDRCRYYWGEESVDAAVQVLCANIDAIDIPLPLLSQHMPDQYLALLHDELQARSGDLLEHKVASVLAQYARACNRNIAQSAVPCAVAAI